MAKANFEIQHITPFPKIEPIVKQSRLFLELIGLLLLPWFTGQAETTAAGPVDSKTAFVIRRKIC